MPPKKIQPNSTLKTVPRRVGQRTTARKKLPMAIWTGSNGGGLMQVFPTTLFRALVLLTILLQSLPVLAQVLKPIIGFDSALTVLDRASVQDNHFYSDSFDSNDPTHSYEGEYDTRRRKANGDIKVYGTNTLSLSNTVICGSVHIAPAGNVMVGTNTAVGDLAWLSNGIPGIQPGHLLTDANGTFANVTAPAISSPSTPLQNFTIFTTNYVTNGTVLTTNVVSSVFDFVFDTGSYKVPSLSGKILVRGDATILSDQVNITNHGTIYILNAASLVLYVSDEARFSGEGIRNESQLASKFTYYGLPSNRLLSFSNNTGVAGCCYAPAADLSIGGGGNDSVDVIGAMVVKSATIKGHVNFHFDEALLPRSLNITRNGNQSVICWPALGTNYVLQSATNLASPHWETTNASAGVPFIITNNSPGRFFRLAPK